MTQTTPLSWISEFSRASFRRVTSFGVAPLGVLIFLEEPAWKISSKDIVTFSVSIFFSFKIDHIQMNRVDPFKQIFLLTNKSRRNKSQQLVFPVNFIWPMQSLQVSETANLWIDTKLSVKTPSKRDIGQNGKEKDRCRKNRVSEFFLAVRRRRKGVVVIAWRTQSTSRFLIIKASWGARLGSASEPSFVSIIVLQIKSNQTKPNLTKSHTKMTRKTTELSSSKLETQNRRRTRRGISISVGARDQEKRIQIRGGWSKKKRNLGEKWWWRTEEERRHY